MMQTTLFTPKKFFKNSSVILGPLKQYVREKRQLMKMSDKFLGKT